MVLVNVELRDDMAARRRHIVFVGNPSLRIKGFDAQGYSKVFGVAQYDSRLTLAQIASTERQAITNGVGKFVGNRYALFALCDVVIGYSNGEPVKGLRVFVNATGYFHGHPTNENSFDEFPTKFKKEAQNHIISLAARTAPQQYQQVRIQAEVEAVRTEEKEREKKLAEAAKEIAELIKKREEEQQKKLKKAAEEIAEEVKKAA